MGPLPGRFLWWWWVCCWSWAEAMSICTFQRTANCQIRAHLHHLSMHLVQNTHFMFDIQTDDVPLKLTFLSVLLKVYMKLVEFGNLHVETTYKDNSDIRFCPCHIYKFCLWSHIFCKYGLHASWHLEWYLWKHSYARVTPATLHIRRSAY